jgi:predicted phosphohydrolase
MSTLLQVASDLHIEQKYSDIDISNMISPCGKILILAGDVGSLYRLEQLKNFLSCVCKKFKYVVYVPGNYEYYQLRGIKPAKNMYELKTDLYALANEFENLVLLDQGVFDLGNNIRIIGTTLWSITNTHPYVVRIKGITKELYNSMHRNDLRFLTTEIEKAHSEGKKTIVVTHYPPIVAPHNRRSKIKQLYENNLDPNIFQYVNSWIYGHTHNNSDPQNDSCKFFTNQMGKEKDAANGYRKDFVIIV